MVDKPSSGGSSGGRDDDDGDGGKVRDVVWSELHDGDTEIVEEGQHGDDVPMGELMGLTDEPPRAKRKTPSGSAIIVHKQIGKKPVKFGTKRSRAEGEPRMLRSRTRGSDRALVHNVAQEAEQLNEQEESGGDEQEARNEYQRERAIGSQPDSDDSDWEMGSPNKAGDEPKAKSPDVERAESMSRNGNLLNEIIKSKRDCIQCPSCNTAGSMVKNGGQTPTSRSWKCREKGCHKQVTGHHIVQMLDSQLGPVWREQATTGTASNEPDCQGRWSTVEPGDTMELAGEEVTIPASEWRSMVQQMEKLAGNCDRLMKEQEDLRQELKQAKFKLEKIENECARNRSTIEERNNGPTKHSVTRARVNNGTTQSPSSQPTQGVVQQHTAQPKGGGNMGHTRAWQADPAHTPGDPNTQIKKLNWAELVKLNCQQSREKIPEMLQEKISKTRAFLTRNNLRATQEPKPVALYFKNVKRGPLGMVRKALRECLPSWALLGLDFVGNSIMEVVTDNQLAARVITTMKMIGIIHVPTFDVFEAALRSHKKDDPNNERKRRNLTAAVHRFKKNAERAKNQWSLGWYKTQLEEAEKRLSSIEGVVQQSSQDAVAKGDNEGRSQDPQQKEGGWTIVKSKNGSMNRSTPSDEGSNTDGTAATSKKPVDRPQKDANKTLESRRPKEPTPTKSHEKRQQKEKTPFTTRASVESRTITEMHD